MGENTQRQPNDEQNWPSNQSELYHSAEVTGSHGSETGLDGAVAHVCQPEDAYTVYVTTVTHVTMKGYTDKSVRLETPSGESGRAGYSRWQSAVASFVVRPGTHEACPLCGDGEEFNDKMFIPEVTEAQFNQQKHRSNYSMDERRRGAVLREAESRFEGSNNAVGASHGSLHVGYHSDLNDINTGIDLNQAWVAGPHQHSIGEFIRKHPWLTIHNVKQREDVNEVDVGEAVGSQPRSPHTVTIKGTIKRSGEAGLTPGLSVELGTYWDSPQELWAHPSKQDR